MAEIRKQALLASGVQIEGLQQPSGSGAPTTKKVVYGNRKKKDPVAKDVSPAPESRPRSPKPLAIVEKPIEEIPANGDAKSDWEASSDENHDDAKAQGEAVKDSWDASSDDEEKPRKLYNNFIMNLRLIYDQQNLLNPWQRITSSLQRPHLPQRQNQHRNQLLPNQHPMGRRLSNLLRKRNHPIPRSRTMMTTMTTTTTIPRTLTDHQKKN